MAAESNQNTRDRILFLLKTRGPLSTSELATRLERTPMGIRQHLKQLADSGLVGYDEDDSGRVGRPARFWRLTDEGSKRFPEGYADLALDLISGVRAAFGEAGMKRLVEARTKEQRTSYAEQMPEEDAPLSKRVAALSRIRSREGYMAEWKRRGKDAFLLIENHCPICAAAQICQGLCGAELDLFRELLGSDVTVERTEHLLEGARRCAYEVRPKGRA